MAEAKKTKKINGQRARASLTTKGLNTRTSLLEAAREVFREQGYYGASVSMICRQAGMSQGAFYQYFKNKEQALLELNDLVLDDFWAKAGRVSLSDPDPAVRLGRVADLLFRYARENIYYHRILGEFELIDSVTIGYYDSLSRFCVDFFKGEIKRGALRPADPELLAYAFIGMVLFHAMDWGPGREKHSIEQLVGWAVKLWRNGIGGPRPWTGQAGPIPARASESSGNAPEPSEGLTQGQATAKALFQAAENVFGQVGFNRAGIAEITRLAGVAQGTFYVHFKSKRDLMEGFVDYLSREMRWAVKKGSGNFQDRRDVEAAGISSFFRFLGPHRRIYRVVAESETMGQEMAMRYYIKLAEGYEPGLAEGAARGEIVADPPPSFLVRSIMGMIHMVGLKWLVWSSSMEAQMPPRHVAEIIEVILNGLAVDRS
ncbi:MAG: TetR/AcrR family transcriptional regulator [Pseudomonadota bacterium]